MFFYNWGLNGCERCGEKPVVSRKKQLFKQVMDIPQIPPAGCSKVLRHCNTASGCGLKIGFTIESIDLFSQVCQVCDESFLELDRLIGIQSHTNLGPAVSGMKKSMSESIRIATVLLVMESNTCLVPTISISKSKPLLDLD